MKISIFWNNINVVNITKVKGLYVSNVNVDSLGSAVNEGMPILSISNIALISKQLPIFLQERLPSKEVINQTIGRGSNDEFSNILRYIVITGCKCVTDKFEVKLL